jgi:uncharacterized damage-inducible protein DinB
MSESECETKALLHMQLKRQRAALFDKLDGVGERQARWPQTPTGTNLLGLLKHCAAVELGYFGATFGRPAADLTVPWEEDNADMYAAQHESVASIVAYAHACFAHADATIETLDLETEGSVAWWPQERRRCTLHHILIHVALDEARHAGHADILREQLDGYAGLRGPGDNLPAWTTPQWANYVARLQGIANEVEDQRCPGRRRPAEPRRPRPSLGDEIGGRRW